MWIYSAKLGEGLRDAEWTIGFRYPPPVGNLRLALRTNGGADAFIHGEVFEHQYYDLPLATPPETILDLGANIGLTAVYFSRRFPNAKIACVEPVPGNVNLLKRNLKLNAVCGTVIPAAIDVRDGRTTIELGAKDYGHRIAIAGEQPSGPTMDVATICVSTVCRQLRWERIGLLKVDIEGHEKELFSNNTGWVNRVDSICIEWHDPLGGVEVEKLASRFGFGQLRQLPGIWFMSREG